MKVADSQGISELCRPVIESFDCELWGIDFKLSSRTRLLRVYIDKSEKSIEIEDCEQISKQISSVLDVEDVIQESMSWRSLRPESIDLFFRVNTLKNMLDQEFSVNYESQNMVDENLMEY